MRSHRLGFGMTGAAAVCVARGGANAAGDALIEFDRSLCTETEVPFCAFVSRLRSGAGGGTHPLRRANR